MGGEYRPILTNIVQGRKHKVDSEFLDGKALEGIWANVWKEIFLKYFLIFLYVSVSVVL